MKLRIVVLSLILAGLATGCGGFGSEELTVDDDVTWTSDIRELLADNCVRCHQSTPQNGAPSGFRFDKYNAAEIPDGKDGAFEKLSKIDARAVRQTPSAMPPGGSLTIGQRGILRKWIETGGPRGEDAGRNPKAVTKP